MKKIFIAIALIALIFALLVTISRKVHAPSGRVTVTDSDMTANARLSFVRHAADMGITQLSIAPFQEVSGVTTLTGYAKGFMFEGSFPVTVVDPTGATVFRTPATAQGEWMTSDPVSFSVSVDFGQLPAGQLSILLSADNPQDGAEVRQLEIPVINKK